MGHAKTERTIDDTIADARAAASELRAAIKDSKTVERQFKATVDGMRTEMVSYSKRLARDLVEELLRREFEHLNVELQRLVAEVEQKVSERAFAVLNAYLQADVEEAPTFDDMMRARRTLRQWQQAWGALPVGHASGSFSLELTADEPKARKYGKKLTDSDESPSQ